MQALASRLPAGVTVFERGWLSANNILFVGKDSAALVDSGYCTHAEQTAALVQQGLNGRPLDLLVNTHLHSDHCGGNAALQANYPQLRTLVPPGQAAHVRDWDPAALSYEPTGQQCPKFTLSGVLEPGGELRLGDGVWQVHAAPGHDPHAIVLFEPRDQLLLSADALWQNGFGVVFPELEGDAAFHEVGATLDLIEHLSPRLVIPGHGAIFDTVSDALELARRRLDAFVQNPRKHATHAAKVLLKFKLLELRRLPEPAFLGWAIGTPYFRTVQELYFPDETLRSWIERLADELIRSGALARTGSDIVNA